MHDLSNYFNSDAVNACCLSPDGTKLYFRRSNMNAFLTIELCQYDFTTSSFSVIAEGHAAPCLTPNNLWVISPYVDISVSPWIPQISVLYQPNEPSSNCGFTQGVYNMIENGFIDVSPNYANFRLGALVGSGCDTLSTSVSTSISAPDLRLKIFPNPTSTYLTIEQDISNICALKITDMLGQTLWQGKTNNQKTILTTEIGQLENGIYWLEIQDLKTGKRAGKKFVKQ
jgi:hypothetical protein